MRLASISEFWSWSRSQEFGVESVVSRVTSLAGPVADADKQGVVCDGGRRSSCGSRNAPLRGHASPTWFLRYVSLDLDGHDNWYCAAADRDDKAAVPRPHNAFTFAGSYYHVYAKLASCRPPTGQVRSAAALKLHEGNAVPLLFKNGHADPPTFWRCERGL